MNKEEGIKNIKELLRTEKILLSLCCHDALSARIIRENILDAPLVANMIEGGLSPILTLEEFEELGYQIVGYPLTTIFAEAKAIKDAVAELRAKGHSKDYQENLATFEEFTSIVRLPEFYNLEQKYSI